MNSVVKYRRAPQPPIDTARPRPSSLFKADRRLTQYGVPTAPCHFENFTWHSVRIPDILSKGLETNHALECVDQERCYSHLYPGVGMATYPSPEHCLPHRQKFQNPRNQETCAILPTTLGYVPLTCSEQTVAEM